MGGQLSRWIGRPVKLLVLISFLFLVTLPTKLLFAQSSPSFDKIAVDSLDADAWNGIVFLPEAFDQRVPFAVRFGSYRSDSLLDGEKIFHAVREVGPHAPDSSYCRLAWKHSTSGGMVTLEWSRIDENTVVGRLTATPNLQLVVEGYFPVYFSQRGRAVSWDADHYAQGAFSIEPSRQAMVAERYLDNVFGHVARFLVMVDRPLTGAGTYPSMAELHETMKGAGKLVSSSAEDPAASVAGLEFQTEGSNAHFVLALGWEEKALSNRAQELLAPGKIDTILSQKSEAYSNRRPNVTGMFAGSPEAIGNSMFWNSIYAPSLNLAFPSISRSWASGWGGWVVGEWDAFFGAILTSLEDSSQSRAAIQAILSAQDDNGLVPNATSASGDTPGRSQPPVGAYATWKVFQRTQDRALLEWAYPRLRRWHEWWMRDRGDGQPWRDGNRDGLLEWGSDRGSAAGPGGRGFMQAAKWETGMDDSPMYDDATYDPATYTMNLNDVGLNSLYALDAECLSKIARILGFSDDEAKFAAEYEHQKHLVRENLWNEQDGIYENRFWNRKFSKRLSPTNFYPLFAGIATPEQAKRMVEEHLLNTTEFWGTYVAPTIARNDPAFSDQFYWRGTIWGPTNYMLYQGINRYGFDKVALDYAYKSYKLFMADWKASNHDNEQYLASGGGAGGDPHYTWGALLVLTALEQYVDKNPWEGLRFGALGAMETGELQRATWDGRNYDIAVGPNRTAMSRDGKLCFESDAGVVVRQYEAQGTRLSFKIKSERLVHVATWELDSGSFLLTVDARPPARFNVHKGIGKLTLPAGEHTIEIVR